MCFFFKGNYLIFDILGCFIEVFWVQSGKTTVCVCGKLLNLPRGVLGLCLCVCVSDFSINVIAVLISRLQLFDDGDGDLTVFFCCVMRQLRSSEPLGRTRAAPAAAKCACANDS